MDRNEDTRDEGSIENRVVKLEEAVTELSQSYLEVRQVLKLFEQDNSMALYGVVSLAEIKEVKKKLLDYIDERGKQLKTFSMFKDG